MVLFFSEYNKFYMFLLKDCALQVLYIKRYFRIRLYSVLQSFLKFALFAILFSLYSFLHIACMYKNTETIASILIVYRKHAKKKEKQ